MIKYFVQKRKNALRPSEPPKYYGVRAAASPVILDAMCRAIAEKTTLTRADIHATLCAIEEQIVKHVKEGHIVKFGHLGTFRPMVNAESVPASLKVEIYKSPSNYVKKVRLRFYPASELRTRVNLEASFEKVESMPSKKVMN